MPKRLEFKTNEGPLTLIINTEVIERDMDSIEAIAEENRTFRQKEIYGALQCIRDNRKYDPEQIQQLCMGNCPFNTKRYTRYPNHPNPDCFDTKLSQPSLDGETPYLVEYWRNHRKLQVVK